MINFYKKQGIAVLPGADTLIGNTKQFEAYTEALKASNGPLCHSFNWVIEQHIGENGLFNSEKNKAIVTNIFGNVLIHICDPAMAQDVFVAKNKYVDKTGIW